MRLAFAQGVPLLLSRTNFVSVSNRSIRLPRARRQYMGNRTMATLVPASEAQERKSSTGGWKHLDVRTVEEYSSLRAPDSTNIPYMNKGPTGMVVNPSFLSDVSAVFGKDTKLLVSCASGKRSARAAAELAADGYEVADVEGGMAAWAETSGLPTESGAPASL